MNTKGNILIIDDDEDGSATLGLILEQHGYKTETVATGQAAMERLQQRFFNVALLGIRLSDMEGIDLLRMCKEKYPDMVVFMITGYASLETAVHAVNEKAAAYITKPVDIDGMLAIIRQTIEQQRLILENRKLLALAQEELAQRKLAEERLQEQNEFLRNVMESITHPFYVVDANDYTVKMANTAACPDVSSGEVMCYTLVHNRHQPCSDPQNCPLERVKSTGEIVVMEHTHHDKNGKTKVVEVHGFPIFDSEGNVVQMIEYYWDITARKEMEQALRESEQKYRALFEDSRDAIYVATREGQFTDVNQAMLELFGYDREEMMALDARMIYADPGMRRQFQQQVEQQGFVRDYEVKFRKKDGTEMECLLTATVRRIENGTVLGYQGIIRDVTQQRKMQERAQQQDRLVAVGQLAAGIAHDFNNILTGMIGYADLALTNPELPPTLRHDIKIILEQGTRAAQLVRQILDFSRKSIIHRQPLDLLPLLKENVKLLQRTIPENIVTRIESLPDRYLVSVDPTQLQQLLTNLAVNARDAMPTGGELRIHLSCWTLQPGEPRPFPDMASGEWICLSVTDTGTGIPADVLPRIYDPFFTTKEVGQGSGLGLSQVYGIVSQHDGFIDVESEVGKGTTFLIYLPSLEKSTGSASDSGDSAIPRGQGETILVVEDEPMVLDVAQSLLESLGYRVLIARNGQEALQAHERHQDFIDLVLSDVVMPEMGGLELYRTLQQRDPSIRIILMSGYPPAESTHEIPAQREVHWIQKPLSLKQVAHTVRGAIDE